MLAMAAGVSVVEASSVVAVAVSVVGAIYTMIRYGGERRAGRIAEEDFYQRMYKDLNETLLKEVERLRREVADRDAQIDKLRAAAPKRR